MTSLSQPYGTHSPRQIAIMQLMGLGKQWNRIKSRLTVLRRYRAVDLAVRGWSEFSSDDGTVYAAAMTYYALLSLFPFLIFLVAVFGLVLGDPALQRQVVDEIVRQLPEGTNLDQQVRSVVEGVAETEKSLLGLTAIVAAGWTASGVFGALRRGLNRAFDVPMARSFIHGRIRDLLAVGVVIVLLMLSTALTATLRIVRAQSTERFDGVVANAGWSIVAFCVPIIVSFVVFLLVYRWVPNHTLGWRDLRVGALIAAVGFELAKVGFGYYLGNFGRYDEVYGTLGGVVAFLVFVFLISVLTILAAEVDSEIAKDRVGMSSATGKRRRTATKRTRVIRRGSVGS